MDHKEPSLFQTRATYLLEVYSRSLQETSISNAENEILWHASSLTEIFLKKSLFGVAYKAREHAILNHKNGNFCTFSVYKNVHMKDACNTI